MTTTNLHPTPCALEQETGAIIRALQNRLINDNPLNEKYYGTDSERKG